MAALKAFTTIWETLQERHMQHRQSLAEGDTDLQSWKQNRFIITGWWFGTRILLFHSVGNVIIPTDFIPQTGLTVWGSYSFQRVTSLGRMILPLSPGLHPTLGALGRMSLHLSPPCLPLWVPWAS